eukprot:199599_1
MATHCNHCSQPSVSSRCGACKKVYYCNQICQRNDWKKHKKQCKKSRNFPKKRKPLTEEEQSIVKKPKPLTEEEQLIQKFQAIPELAEFVAKLQNNPDRIAFYLDHPKRVKHMIQSPFLYTSHGNMSYDQADRIDDDPINIAKYKQAKTINENWFKKHSQVDIIHTLRDEIQEDNASKTLSTIIESATNMLFNVHLTKKILHVIESYALIHYEDHKINIIELSAKELADDLYCNQVEDIHWIENNVLNQSKHDLKTGYFSKMIEQKLYKNHNNMTSLDGDDDGMDDSSGCEMDCWDNSNTILYNNRLSCGDLVYVDLNCSDFIPHKIAGLWYIVDVDHKTLRRIGLFGFHLSYIYGQHIVIPFSITSRFVDPLQQYLTLFHIAHREMGPSDVQIELQVSNTCNAFNQNAKHHTLTKQEEKRLLSIYPWPNTEVKSHKYKWNLNEMGGGNASDVNYCTIYIDLSETMTEEKSLFGYCNDEAIECIHLGITKETALQGYVVKYKGTKSNVILSEQQVDELLLKYEDDIAVDKVSKCLKKGLAHGLITIDEKKGLNTVILNSRCNDCDKKIKCRIRHVLYQPDIGGDIYGVVENDEIGEDVECFCGNYVTSMCAGNMYLESGKYHHHCTACPALGSCIGDSKYGHCEDCNEHYYWGKGHQLLCPNCNSDS